MQHISRFLFFIFFYFFLEERPTTCSTLVMMMWHMMMWHMMMWHMRRRERRRRETNAMQHISRFWFIYIECFCPLFFPGQRKQGEEEDNQGQENHCGWQKEKVRTGSSLCSPPHLGGGGGGRFLWLVPESCFPQTARLCDLLTRNSSWEKEKVTTGSALCSPHSRQAWVMRRQFKSGHTGSLYLQYSSRRQRRRRCSHALPTPRSPLSALSLSLSLRQTRWLAVNISGFTALIEW